MQHMTFSHGDFLQPGEAYHLARSVLPVRRPRVVHDHDFPELFWVQHGGARHHVNGTLQTLSEGDVLFIRPNDRHGFQGLAADTHVVNIVLWPPCIAELGARFPELSGRYFWSDARLPTPIRRSSTQLIELSRAAMRLESGTRNRLRIEAFLLGLLSDLDGPSRLLPEDGPEWLLAACRAAEHPEVFREGAAGFVAVTGRAHAHVSRTARRFLGQTPSDFINTIRMDHAARCLISSDDSLIAIARDCGIENMSHFHRLFKSRHGATPRAWRARHQREVVQPA